MARTLLERYYKGMKNIRQISLGAAWIAALRDVYQSGRIIGDETQESLLLEASFEECHPWTDPLLRRYGSLQKIEEMRKVFFTGEENLFGHSYRDWLRGPRRRPRFKRHCGPACPRSLVQACGGEPRRRRRWPQCRASTRFISCVVRRAWRFIISPAGRTCSTSITPMPSASTKWPNG